MRRLLGFLLLISIFLLLLAAISPNTGLSAQNNEGPPKNLPDHVLLGDYYLDTGQQQSPPRSMDRQSAHEINDYSMFSFMSLRHGNWEIYTANDEGDDVERLTSDQAVDSSPRFNKGAKKIAFDSNRSGNFEIYTMTRSGDSLQRLTNNGADDYSPAWSPDGSQIVFVSNRDGQPEIYVMNATGGGQRRLTNHAAGDFDPHWSPDGSKIVFASTRNGYGIWVMGEDGSNQRQLVKKRFSQNPVWSPDGSQIAFDADGSGDGWQEIWVMDSNGDNQRVIYQTNDDVDPYVRSWSPDGKLVSFTKTVWIEYNGNWYWTYAYAYYTRIDRDLAHSIGLSSSLDWYPDWQTTDATPPTSSVDPLPEYSSEDVSVSWHGSDGGGSGIKNYDIQYRVGITGEWQDWQMPTYYESAEFEKILGKTVYFRSRARDRAGQLEPWPSGDGDTHTAFITTRLSGQITDNTKVPVPGTILTTTQQTFPIDPSAISGSYQVLFHGDEPAIEVEFLMDGYGSLPVASVTPFKDNHLDVLLPPSDNILDNPDFETVSFYTNTWQADGLYTPTLSSAVQHTGEKAALLGTAFDLETLAHFGANVTFSEKTAPRQDGNGIFHIVWRKQISADEWKIYYASGDRDGNWSDPVSIATSTDRPDNLHYQATADGIVHLVWKERKINYDVLYHRWKDNAGWHEKQVVNDVGLVTSIDFKLDNTGAGHLLWYLYDYPDSDHFYSTVSKNGVWSTPELLISETIGDFYDMEIDQDTGVHLLSRYNYYLAYTYRSPDGSWSKAEKIVNYWRGQEMALDENGGIHVIWTENSGTQLHHAKRGEDGGWPSKQIDNGIDPYEHGSTPFTPIAGPDGTVFFFYREDNPPCRKLIRVKIDDQGQWAGTRAVDPGTNCSPPFWVRRQQDQIILLANYKAENQHQLCQTVMSLGEPNHLSECTLESTEDFGTGYPYPLVGDDGLSHFFWAKNLSEGGNGLLHSRSPVSPSAGDSQLKQSVSIPEEMSNPVLSLAYRQGYNAGDPELNLQISIEDALQSTLIFTGTQTQGWSYETVDLQDWAGEEVTLRFSLDQKAGTAVAWAYLDEVNLGTGHPDSWIKIDTQTIARPGDVIEVVLNYGNRSIVPAVGSVVTASIPTEFELISTSTPPNTIEGTELLWELGTLDKSDRPTAITLTLEISPDMKGNIELPISATISGTTAELIQFNNVDLVIVEIHRRVYLPMVFR